MSRVRPVFLDLRRIALPLPGLVSILHRVSGLLLVLALPSVAWLVERALSGPEGFAVVVVMLDAWPSRLLQGVLLWSLLHHLLAGLRHLALDLGWGLERVMARRTAWLTLVTALVLLVGFLLVGGWR
ncbi:succinate dehydrogenase / fumarate reductase cytochrome b subunit [Allochromatium warmingii]|uniref:Succinate dehydrogenase cytochrome b556 subunit n=1 Tax=Allochromatium warmingii TaxID=61595 RepID=A0A1H3BN22_ALLWA|nr:succinate dehydrogenase, cytochrome b556 subunit [Allochromatium warmingii]SDX42509.1 succinate dehydrogenase / fumarate reductase cytochrome b subunit [Allochromatium warmingii]